MLEATFRTKFLKHLRNKGWFCQTIETSTGNGVPDAVIIKNGVTHWLEFKVGSSAKLRTEQYAWHTLALRHNVSIYTVCYNPKTRRVSIFDFSRCKKTYQKTGWKLEEPDFEDTMTNIVALVT